jgi:hypothetical protein
VTFDRELIEAALALEMIPPVGMPELGRHALEAGLDGPALRLMEALRAPTDSEIAPLLINAKAEMGLTEVSKGEAALRMAKLLAKEILAHCGVDNPLHLGCAKQFEWLWIKGGYPQELLSVGHLPGEIELAKMKGQTIAQIREWTLDRLKALNG